MSWHELAREAATAAKLGVDAIGRVRLADDAEDADTAECGIQHVVAAGEGAGVGCSGLATLRGTAGLDDDDGLGERHFAGGR